MPTSVLVLGAVALGCVPAARLLARASWPRRAPVTAIALWQALGLAWGLATVGVLIGLGALGLRVTGHLASVATSAAERSARLLSAQGHSATLSWSPLTALGLFSLLIGVALLALLCCILFAAIAAALRARRRQRTLLGLLARGDPKVPGALVVDHPAATAYCVPGLRSAIVVSAGALDLLDAGELAAVLAHERAHLRARHDLVLLPFTALLLAFRWSAVARQANTQVALLVEMLADDRARRGRSSRELATALLRVGAAGGGAAPAGALAAIPAPDCGGSRPSGSGPSGCGVPPGDRAPGGATSPGASTNLGGPSTATGEVAARVTRLLRPPPGLSALAVAALGLAAALLVLAPITALLLPI